MPTHDDNGRVSYRERQIGPWFSNLHLKTCKHPMLAIDRCKVEGEHLGVDVKVLWQGVFRSARINQRADFFQIKHGHFPITSGLLAPILADVWRSREYSNSRRRTSRWRQPNNSVDLLWQVCGNELLPGQIQ